MKRKEKRRSEEKKQITEKKEKRWREKTIRGSSREEKGVDEPAAVNEYCVQPTMKINCLELNRIKERKENKKEKINVVFTYLFIGGSWIFLPVNTSSLQQTFHTV